LAQTRTAVNCNDENAKLGQKGSFNPLLEFWDPPNILGTVGARNFKFDMETNGGEF